MKKMLLKRAMMLLILVALLILFTSHLSFAGSMNDPLCSVIVNRNGTPNLIKDMSGQWTNPILVSSNKKSNAYTGEDTINGNLFWGNIYADFLGTGNFVAQVYIEIKDNTLRKEIIKSLKSDISKQPSLAMTGHPDLFTYMVYYTFFDMEKNVVSLRKWEKFLDRDGDLIMLRNAQEDIPLDTKSDFKLIADGIIAVLNKAKNDPKIADRIREMQEYGSNMTEASRFDAARNVRAMYAHSQSASKLDAMYSGPKYLTATDLYSKLNALYDAKTAKYADPAKAIDYLNEIIRRSLDLANSYYCRGVAYHGLGQYQLAINDYDQAIRLKPDFANPYGNRGLAYEMLGQHQRAIEDYDKAIRLKPDAAIVYDNRGSAYDRSGQHQRAIEDYDKAIRLQPNYAEAFCRRGEAYTWLDQYQRAISDLNEAIRLKPDFAQAYSDRGFAYNNLGQYQRAISDLNEAIRLKPDFANPYRHRGNSSRNLGQYQPAIKDYNEAIRLKPNYAEAYSDRGLVYILSGNNPEGCRSLIRACELGYCKDFDLSKEKGDCR